MSEAKFTPGPWWTDGKYQTDEMGVAIIASNVDAGPAPGNPTRGMIAWSSQILEENAAECEANASLIAAAPELYEALENCIGLLELIKENWIDYDHIFSIGVHDAVAALAKARGKTK